MIAQAILSDYETERGKPMPSKMHARIQGYLVTQLINKYDEQFTILPEISIALPKELASDKKGRVPDIAIYPADISFEHEEIRMKEIPLGIIEILSPKQDLTELITRKNIFFKAGILSYWIILPELKSIYVYDTIDSFNIFSKEDNLLDNKLKIKIDLKQIFKGIGV
jgi:Uma2 family endonuclease